MLGEDLDAASATNHMGYDDASHSSSISACSLSLTNFKMRIADWTAALASFLRALWQLSGSAVITARTVVSSIFISIFI